MRFIAPQFATLSDAAPTGPGWAFEMKYDGYRIQAHVNGRSVRLFTRAGLDWTDRLPEIAKALEGIAPSAVFDGEVVSPGEGDKPFQRLQQALDGKHSRSPKLVAEVSFTEWTADGQLRHPAFQGLREDKDARDIIRERPKRRAQRR